MEIRDPRSKIQNPKSEIDEAHRAGFVAVVGKPNVGKSTLINACVGQKIASVSDKPQTSRTRQLGILTRPGAQIVFVDTPGIHTPLHVLGAGMLETAAECLADADVIVFLVDGAAPPSDEDRHVAALIQARAAGQPVILALNKCDLLPAGRVELYAQAYLALLAGAGGPPEWMALSATSGYHREQLLDAIVARLPCSPPYYEQDALTDKTERELAAEAIREQVLKHTHQEVPHGVAVVVNEWKERPAGKLYIGATIFVEKASHKGIVIGRQGHMLKTISSAARLEIEALTGRPVFLEIWVKVSKNWRKRDSALRWLGYAVPKHER